MYWYECVFFFSSRRRHTRYWRDWSSDVCSSDLRLFSELTYDEQAFRNLLVHGSQLSGALAERSPDISALVGNLNRMMTTIRSEERRVGKECRSRWSPYH